jgi:dienelactone hydrolase
LKLPVKKLVTVLGFCSAVTTQYVQAAEETVTLNTRGDITMKFRLISGKNPIASVILFPGGKGKIKVTDYGIGKTGNFLVRTRNVFAKQGTMVAVVDAPSDRQGEEGMMFGFRTSPEHVIDIDTIIDYLQKRTGMPVWLIGTSRGTESAAYVANHTSRKIQGLVLTSSMSRPNAKGLALTEMVLDKIKVPVLITTHKNDRCHVTPPDGAKKIKNALVNAPKVEIKYYTGGKRPRSKPCKAKSQHGYFGIEDKVVRDIVAFLKNNRRM